MAKEWGRTKVCHLCNTQSVVPNVDVNMTCEEIFYSKVELKEAKTLENIVTFGQEYL